MDTHTERAATGIAGLDEVLGGGFPVGKVYLIEGDPGAGKSTLGLQFLRDGVARGERCVYAVLAESIKELRGLARSHGWSIDGIDLIESSGQSDSDYTLYHPSEVELSETSKSILNQIGDRKPQRVVIDSLSEVRLLAQDPLRYRRQILALKRYFDEQGATVLLLDFLTGTDDRQLESLCHGIIHLGQLTPEYGGQRRRLRIKKMRESDFRDGYHDFVITQDGLDVFPRMVAAAHHRRDTYTPETCSSGLPELDSLLGGGLDRGTSTLLLGPAGSGKSTIAAQYAKAAVERGEKAAFFIFDEVPATLIVRGEGLGMGIREHIAKGRIVLRQVDPAQLSPGEFAQAVRRAVEVDGCTVIVIDSVNGYTSAMPEEHFLSAHLHELLAFLNQKSVVTIMVMTQQGLIGNMQQPIDLSYLADTIILLRYFEARSQIRQAISVVKRRTGRHERTIRELTMDGDGVHIGDPLNEFQGVISGNLIFVGASSALRISDGDPAQE
ncbi:MAG: kaiC 1 [Myxococcales bacterium]|nr:kaiC 1 [Myxococcales bacterium]